MNRDNRIGKRAETGRVVQKPTRYATGAIYNPVSNSAPTIFWLDDSHFVYLEVRQAQLTRDQLNELRDVIGLEPLPDPSAQAKEDAKTVKQTRQGTRVGISNSRNK